MLLQAIIEKAGLRASSNFDRDANVSFVTSDSRFAKEGSLFFCVKGIHSDGHRYANEALKNGASAIVAEEGRERELLSLGVPILTAKNTRSALSYALDAFYGEPSKTLKIIAVTGTNGKTTISHMIASILMYAGLHVGLIGSNGVIADGKTLELHKRNPLANMTTPDPEELYFALSKLKECGIEYAVMEASSHSSHFDKLSPLYFIAAVFSNLSGDHLDLHGSMENYFRAKKAVIERSERAIININDSYGRRLFDELGRERAVSVSEKDKKAGYYIKDKRSSERYGISYRLVSPIKETEIHVPVIGEFQFENTLLAAACAYETGVPLSVIRGALSDFRGVSGRMEKIYSRDIDIYIDYAHTAGALQRVLDSFSLERAAGRRIIALFGCGGERDREKRPIMGRIASEGADMLIITADNSRGEETKDIINDILSGVDKRFSETVVSENRAEAIEHAVENAKSGDIILLLGKGHERYEIDKYGRHPFDERAVALGACIKRASAK